MESDNEIVEKVMRLRRDLDVQAHTIKELRELLRLGAFHLYAKTGKESLRLHAQWVKDVEALGIEP